MNTENIKCKYYVLSKISSTVIIGSRNSSKPQYGFVCKNPKTTRIIGCDGFTDLPCKEIDDLEG